MYAASTFLNNLDLNILIPSKKRIKTNIYLKYCYFEGGFCRYLFWLSIIIILASISVLIIKIAALIPWIFISGFFRKKCILYFHFEYMCSL